MVPRTTPCWSFLLLLLALGTAPLPSESFVTLRPFSESSKWLLTEYSNRLSPTFFQRHRQKQKQQRWWRGENPTLLLGGALNGDNNDTNNDESFAGLFTPGDKIWENIINQKDNGGDKLGNAGEEEVESISEDENIIIDESDDDVPPLTYSCRIVTSSDGKLPTQSSLLPQSLYEPPELLAKLDSIYHAVAHETTRDLAFMTEDKYKSSINNNSKQQQTSLKAQQDEEELVISVLRTSLEDAGFELLSRRDLDLCAALNAEYLLRLSIQEDLKALDDSLSREFYPERFDANGTLMRRSSSKSSSQSSSSSSSLEDDDEELLYDGRVLVFRRGYGQELTKGRLLLPKIDYLQASIVQRVASWVRRRLNIVEDILARQSKSVYRKVEYSSLSAAQNAIDLIPSRRLSNWTQMAFVNAVDKKKKEERENQKRKEERRFKLERYGGYRKGLVVSSPVANPDDALTPFMICEIDYGNNSDDDSEDPSSVDKKNAVVNGYSNNTNRMVAKANDAVVVNQTMEGSEAAMIDHDIYEYLNLGKLTCQYDDERMNSDRGEGKKPPPMQLLERVSISNLVDFSPTGRRNILKTLFAKNELLEPTYEEVVVVWRPLPPKPEIEPVIRPPKFIYDFADMFDLDGLPEVPKREVEETPRPSFEIRAFAGVPMANLPAVLPKTKLVFRPADAFVFDLISIVSLLLVLGSQRFDNPRLDLLALVSFCLWVVRTIFRYSNKLARYDLLVKKFLTSKITHRNAGALKYVATEAGSYRATRAALVYTWLASSEREVMSGASNSRDQLIRDGLAGVNALIREDKQVRVDIDAALRDLEELGLVRFSEDGQRLDAVVRDTTSMMSSLSDYWAKVLEGGKSFVDTVRMGK